MTAKRASADPALEILAGLVLEDGHRWGEAAVAAQWEDAAVLDPDPTAPPYHFLTRSRGFEQDIRGSRASVSRWSCSKAASRRSLVCYAADRDQGRLLTAAVRRIRRPDARSARRPRRRHLQGDRPDGTVPRNPEPPRRRIAWGLLPRVPDRRRSRRVGGLRRAPRALWQALGTSALAKVKGARLVVLTVSREAIPAALVCTASSEHAHGSILSGRVARGERPAAVGGPLHRLAEQRRPPPRVPSMPRLFLERCLEPPLRTG